MLRLIFMTTLFVFVIPAPADDSAPRRLVESTTEKMLSILERERDNIQTDPRRIYELIEAHLLPHFDFVGMSRFVVGKHWRKASKDEKRRFVLAFRDLLVRTYASTLEKFSNQTVHYLPARKGDIKTNRAMIRAEIEDNQNRIAVVYRLWEKNGKWQVYDIIVEGVSLLTNFRSQLSEEVSQNGMDATINKIKEDTKALDGGAQANMMTTEII